MFVRINAVTQETWVREKIVKKVNELGWFVSRPHVWHWWDTVRTHKHTLASESFYMCILWSCVNFMYPKMIMNPCSCVFLECLQSAHFEPARPTVHLAERHCIKYMPWEEIGSVYNCIETYHMHRRAVFSADLGLMEARTSKCCRSQCGPHWGRRAHGQCFKRS